MEKTWADNKMEWLEFIETSIFTKQIKSLLDDEMYAKFQMMLIQNPNAGDLMVGGGGIRKVRYRLKDTGKSGGMRAIYYYHDEQGRIYLLVAYAKSEFENLSQEQLNVLKTLVKQEFKNG